MSYHIYTSEAVILKKRDAGEAGRVFSFFTKDFGRLEIAAQGVRHLKSKLRYGLTGFSFVRIAFVATGGEYWRLVDAEESAVLGSIRASADKMRYVSGVFSVLARLIQGQERDLDLWTELENFLLFLENNELAKEHIREKAVSTTLKAIALLGYADGSHHCTDPAFVIRHALSQSML